MIFVFEKKTEKRHESRGEQYENTKVHIGFCNGPSKFFSKMCKSITPKTEVDRRFSTKEHLTKKREVFADPTVRAASILMIWQKNQKAPTKVKVHYQHFFTILCYTQNIITSNCSVISAQRKYIKV